MAEPADIATAIATEVAKQLPVKDAYDDAVKPAAQQLGNITADIAKTILLVLAPLQLTGALQDRFRAFLDRSVRNVPEERRLPPPPQILGPVLEGIRYEPSDSSITEMFSVLLSTSIDKNKVSEAHPAFPQIIKQLSSDEAHLLKSMWLILQKDDRSFRQQFTRDYDHTTNTFHGMHIEIDEIPRNGLIFPENIEFYGQHLYALGIAAFFDSANQDPIFANGRQNPQTGIRIYKEFRLTDVGRRFMSAVSNSV
ncbi:Abi-alpha family protein [Rhizobium nepotum]|uniref:Abi-alpha family protein n=1 Tax=Rhizobium nepotum TaxID=1035271 RepID=UPI00336A430C